MTRVSVEGSEGVQKSSMFFRMSFVRARGTDVTAAPAPYVAPHDSVVFVESKAVLVGGGGVEVCAACDVVVGFGTAEGWISRLAAGAVA